jgi:N5-(carboxyethyl)ornithine synthase
MKLGFVIPTFPYEKRVALLPEHIESFENEVFIEQNFGKNLDIEDKEYEKKGCRVLKREEIYNQCEAVFNLKLTQKEDYDMIKEKQMLIGWTHPIGSGKQFMTEQAIPKELTIVDLDNICPAVYFKDKKYRIDWIPRDFVRKNSFNAGFASVYHALVSFGKVPNSNTEVAVLSPGNVSQGALNIISKLGADTRVFYRKTMNEFHNAIDQFDIIINGIEIDTPKQHIINKEQLAMTKKGCLIIDAAADVGNAIEGTRLTSVANPLYKENGRYFYVVDNSPSLFYKTASYEISKSFSKWVYRSDVSVFKKLIKK